MLDEVTFDEKALRQVHGVGEETETGNGMRTDLQITTTMDCLLQTASNQNFPLSPTLSYS